MSERPLALVVTWFYDDQNGFLTYRQRIVALAATWRVVLILRDDRFKKDFSDLPISIKVIAARSGSRFALLWWCARVGSWLSASQPDLVVLLGTQAAPVALGLGSSIPTVLFWNVHPSQIFNPDVPKALTRALNAATTHVYYRAARRARLILPIGSELRRDLIQKGVDPLRAITLPLGIPSVHELKQPTKLRGLRPGETLRLVMAGSINVQRGRDIMMQSVAQLRHEGFGVHLELVGANSDQARHCNEQIRARGVQGAVTVRHRVTSHEVPEILGNAHLGLSLLRDSPWAKFNPPTKIYEYLASGLPVVASDVDIHRNMIVDRKNGWLCRFEAADLSRILRELLENPAQITQASAAAYGSAQPFLWSRLEADFIGLCQRTQRETTRGAEQSGVCVRN